jgi:three-Cys-motif partner protein
VIRRARDSLRARVGGPWSQEKLTYVQRYATAFMNSMMPKRRSGLWSELVYLDFLAGPGVGIDRRTGIEFPGSPLRALQAMPPFDRLVFSDVDARNVDTLRRRIPEPDRVRVELCVGDCHEVARRVVGDLSNRALALAFVDPEGFEVKFRLFETLAAKRVDVLYLFPGGIGVARNLGTFARKANAPLDDLIPGWRELRRARVAAGQRLSQDEIISRDQPFVTLLMQRMSELGFLYSGQGEPYFTNQKNVKMYHLLFFSKHPTGLALWRGVTRIEPSGQRQLF